VHSLVKSRIYLILRVLCCYIYLLFSSSILSAFSKLRKATVSFVMSVLLSDLSVIVCPHGTTSAPTGRIWMKFDIWVFFENLLRKFNFHENLTRITGTLHVDQYTFDHISHSFFRVGNVSDKFVQKIKTHTYYSVIFFSKWCKLWDNVEKYIRALQARDENMLHAHLTLVT
jgi:hypothetical protein